MTKPEKEVAELLKNMGEKMICKICDVNETNGTKRSI